MPSLRCASFLALLLIASAGCRGDGPLVLVESELAIDPAEGLGFPATPIHGRTVRLLRLTNVGGAPLELGIVTEGPFTVDPLELLRPGEVRTLEVAFSPLALGRHGGRLRITRGETERVLTLSGEGGAPCASSSCADVTVDPVSGQCVSIAQVDGVPCQDTCLEEAVCLGGQCRGTPASCDDGNACTLDACVTGEGCRNQAITCEPASPCESAVCDPVAGCGTVPVADGTSCGTQACDGAQVCMSGECVVRVPPEGAACGERSPCQQMGACRAGRCEQPPPTELRPIWTLTPPSGSIDSFRPLIVDEDGALYGIELNQPNRLFSIDRDGRLRFLGPEWVRPSAGPLLEGRSIVLSERGRVSAFDAQGGGVKWEVPIDSVYFDVEEDPPDEPYQLSVAAVPVSPREGEVSFFVSLRSGAGCIESRVLTFSADSGTVLDRHVIPSHCSFPSPVSDGAGRIAFAASDRAALGRVSRGGGFRWVPSEGIRETRAWGRNTLFTSRSDDAGTPVLAGVSAETGTQHFLTDIAFAPGAVRTGDDWLFAIGTTESLVHFRIARLSSATGENTWDTTGAVYGNPLLTDRGSLLYSELLSGGRQGLTELQADGRVAWSCPVPQAMGIQGLHEGRLYLGSSTAIMAFELPGLGLAPRGWVSQDGDPQRRRRPR